MHSIVYIVCFSVAFRLLALQMLAVLFANEVIAQGNEPKGDLYRLWATGSSPARREFEFSLIRLLLDESVKQYGPYTFEVSKIKFSRYDALDRVADGRFDLGLVPHWDEEPDFSEKLITIPFAVWSGYLGYRQLVVRKDRIEDFENLRSLQALKKLTVGQGESWRDNHFYRRNNIKVVEAQTFKSLFTMLQRGRFDCVPLGVNEINGTLNSLNGKKGKVDFAVVPGVLVHYPLHIYFIVGKHNKKLAHRLDYSLKNYVGDGRYDAMLNTFMGDKLKVLQDPETIVIEL